jgi:carboxyl-terminal processing protease
MKGGAGFAWSDRSSGACYRRASAAVVTALFTLVLAGCGGGGGNPVVTSPASAGQASATPAPPAGDAIGSSALSENLCAAPRSGTDPSTGLAFADQPGTLVQEKSWVRAWIDETYLWYDEVPTALRADAYPTPQAFFDVLRTPAVTPSGKPRDQFHFMYPTAVWEALSQSGIEAGYGFDLAIVKPQPPREVRIAYAQPGTPAAQAGIGRGAKVIGVDGIDVVNSKTVDALNAALFPAAAGQSHSFDLQQLDGSLRTVVLTSAQIARVPVQNVETLETATGRVGYLQFNDHVAPSEAQLIAAIARFKADGVQDLVLDIRYNGGGLLDIASELAYMVAGPAATTGAVFEQLQFNRKNPFQLTDAQTRTDFHSTSQGFSTPAGQPLPQLGLSRVTVLTGPDTCSASESIINGLRGVNVQVTQVGNTTCGKPYGFLPQDNCGTTYFAIQFKGVNNQGFGDYADGIAPTCAVADDFSHPLGDAAEGRLAAALSYRVTGSCPPVTTAALQSGLLSTGEPLLSGKSPARSSRLLREGAFSPR